MANTPMTRIARENLEPQWQAAWDRLNSLTGEPAFIEVLSHAPELLNFAMVEFYQKIFFEGRVAEKYKQLARIRLSLAHGCKSCNLQNTIGMKEAGYTLAHIEAIETDARAPFDDAEKAVLALADQMLLTNPGGVMSKDIHNRLSAHFSEPEICELGVVMGFLAGFAKMAFVFDIVEKEATCPFMPGAAAIAAE